MATSWFIQNGWWYVTIVDQYGVTCGPFKIRPTKGS